jgi:hypothetical protein
MADKKGKGEPTLEMLQKMLIVQLGLAGVPQQQIRRVVGCDINTVNGIVRHLRIRKRPKNGD